MKLKLSYLNILLASFCSLSEANLSFSASSSTSTSNTSSASFSASIPLTDVTSEESALNKTDEHPIITPDTSIINDGKNPTDINWSNKTTTIPTDDKLSSKKVVGYYPSYSSDLTPLSELNYDLYDELIFFTATTNNNFTIGTGNLTQTHWDTLANEFVTRCKNATVTPTLALGGWTGCRYFSDLVATAENRTEFATSLVDFAKKYEFEGIDIDWEYPILQGIGCNSVRDEDLDNFTLFLEKIREIWPGVHITADSSINGFRDSSYASVSSERIAGLVKVLDKVNIMAYDVYGGWSDTTGPSAPLSSKCADVKSSVEDALGVYLKQGFSQSQLRLGIPTYARSFGLGTPELIPKTVGNYTTYYYQNFTSIPAGGIADDKPGVDICGQTVGNGGLWMFKELIENGFLSEDEKEGMNGYVLYQDECSGVPFLANNMTLISYDDTQSSVRKAKWARESGLSGIIFFNAIGSLDRTIGASREEFLKN
ncbi:hypothetical protein CROQUDRAFT_715110 [Cronartium quercuum f. sp. fusiforme G11]|uniref:GH18 domain-containing protein n=1 Tax=Cronartium quercuum f. sp. fusiforme G11 TaxID=708437 RepID=A0A9P6NJV5_9BASI|nr:hypothetical protein CROQUDRAFT_715110 [Cronartium quercuum f. sp. fusiforme G11]